MSQTIVTRPIGPTFALSVGAAQHAPVAIPPVQGETSNYAEFTNIGSTDVCVVVTPFSAVPSSPTLVFPLDGVPTVPSSFLLPHGMTQPRVVAVPANGFCVSAIGSASGPSIFYLTQVSSV